MPQKQYLDDQGNVIGTGTGSYLDEQGNLQGGLRATSKGTSSTAPTANMSGTLRTGGPPAVPGPLQLVGAAIEHLPGAAAQQVKEIAGGYKDVVTSSPLFSLEGEDLWKHFWGTDRSKVPPEPSLGEVAGGLGRAVYEPTQQVIEGFQAKDPSAMAEGMARFGTETAPLAAGAYGLFSGMRTPPSFGPRIAQPKPPKWVEQMSKGMGGQSTLNYQNELFSRLPPLENILKQGEKQFLGGAVKNKQDALFVTRASRNNYWSREIQPFVKAAGDVDLTPVSDYIISRIPETMKLDPVAYQKRVANIRKRWEGVVKSAEEVEQLRQEARARARTLLGKNPFERAAAEKTPNYAIKNAEYEALRDVHLDHIQQRTGVDLKERFGNYGKLSELEQDIGELSVDPSFWQRMSGRATAPDRQGRIRAAKNEMTNFLVSSDAYFRRAFGNMREYPEPPTLSPASRRPPTEHPPAGPPAPPPSVVGPAQAGPAGTTLGPLDVGPEGTTIPRTLTRTPEPPPTPPKFEQVAPGVIAGPIPPEFRSIDLGPRGTIGKAKVTPLKSEAKPQPKQAAPPKLTRPKWRDKKPPVFEDVAAPSKAEVEAAKKQPVSGPPTPEPKPVIKKGKDFELYGVWEVEIGGQKYKMFRDPETRNWYEDKTITQPGIGPQQVLLSTGTKEEAIQTLTKRTSSIPPEPAPQAIIKTKKVGEPTPPKPAPKAAKEGGPPKPPPQVGVKIDPKEAAARFERKLGHKMDESEKALLDYRLFSAQNPAGGASEMAKSLKWIKEWLGEDFVPGEPPKPAPKKGKSK